MKTNQIIEEEITITLKQLAEYCQAYDANGDNSYPENKFEGVSVFFSVYEEITKKLFSEDFHKKYFAYEDKSRYGDKFLKNYNMKCK